MNRNAGGKFRFSVAICVIPLLGLAAAGIAQSVQPASPAPMSMEEARLRNDWAWLGRYRDENAAAGLPGKGETRVVFLGDSITDLWRAKRPEFFESNGHLDRGISGQTTPQMLVRFRADVVKLKPKVVVILGGINDIAGNTGPSTLEMIEDNLASMAEMARANGIKVVLASVLPAYDFPWHHGLAPAEKIPVLNVWIRSYAARNGLVYLDYYSAMVDERKGLKQAYTQDGVHPNEEGYKVMEPLAERAIAEALRGEAGGGRNF